MRGLRVLLICVLIGIASVILWGQEVIESVVAIVNDDIITLSDYKREYESLYQSLKNQLDEERFLQQLRLMRKELLERMITELLLMQEAKKRGMNVREQVRRFIDGLKEENGLNSDEELKRLMAQQGISFDAWRKQIEQEFMKQAVVVTEVDRKIALDDSEIVNYHKTHEEEFREPAEFKLRAIYILERGRSSGDVEALKEEITSKIAAGEDFATLAGTYTEGPEKASQGDLGRFKQGELEKTLEEAVERLNQGEVTPWLKVKDGWYLLKLEEKQESRIRSFEEARKEIEDKLFNERREKRLAEFLQELKEESYIKIVNPNPLNFD